MHSEDFSLNNLLAYSAFGN